VTATADGLDVILIVDDEHGMRETLTDILDVHGLVGRGAPSGADALATQANLTPAVALVDHGLPDMTGLELCAALKSADADIQVVVLTGRATLENAIAAVGQADEFLTKPVDPDELVRVVRGALLRRQLRRENAELIVRLRESNSRLEASISDRTRDLAGLASMAEAIAASQDVDEVLAAVVRTVAEATGAGATGVYLIDELTGGPVLAATWPSADAVPATIAPPPRGTDSLMVVPDTRGDIWLQLVVGGERLGVLTLSRPARVNSSFLQTVAVEAAVSIQNAQRFARERETVERLSEISRLKSAFLASVSHELRTPLTAVVGFAQTLGNYGQQLSPEDRKHMLERIVVQGERLRRLINNLLDSTALETGTLRVSAGPVDAVEVVRRVVDSLGDDRGRVAIEVPDDLPPVWSDEGRLEQVLGNLLDNAVKHSPDDRPITVSAAAGASTVSLRVSDEGPGIDPAFLSRLFDPFTQADTSDSRRQQGVGLGLYIAHGLVTAMGGEIEVETALGEGTTFVVELPRAVS
jgi:signal transduction histidine kinase